MFTQVEELLIGDCDGDTFESYSCSFITNYSNEYLMLFKDLWKFSSKSMGEISLGFYKGFFSFIPARLCVKFDTEFGRNFQGREY